MEPTLQEGSFVLIKKQKPGGRVKVGDIIVFNSGGEVYIKRIDSINDLAVMVRGDNPRDSIDSRDFGPIDRKNIIGKVIWH